MLDSILFTKVVIVTMVDIRIIMQEEFKVSVRKEIGITNTREEEMKWTETISIRINNKQKGSNPTITKVLPNITLTMIDSNSKTITKSIHSRICLTTIYISTNRIKRTHTTNNNLINRMYHNCTT